MIEKSGTTVLILGATGKTGSYAVRHALDAQDDVHVFVRNPGKLPAAFKSRVGVISDDLTDPAAVAEAVKKVSPAAIIICSGHSRKDRIAPLNSIAVDAIVTALTETHRLGECFVIYLSGLFCDPAYDPLPWYFKLLRATLIPLSGYQAAVRDNLAVTEYLTAGKGLKSGLQFTIIRMGPPIEAASKGTIIPVNYLPIRPVTFNDMGLFMVKLAHGEQREEVLGKAIKAFYANKA